MAAGNTKSTVPSPGPGKAKRSVFPALAEKFQSIVKVLNLIAAGCLGALVGLMTVDVVARYFLNKPIPWAYDVYELLLVGVFFLALGYTYYTKGHVRVDFLTTRLPLKWQVVLDLVTRPLTLAVLVLITWQGWLAASEAWVAKEVSSGIPPVPVFPAKITVAIGGAAITLEVALETYASILKLLGMETSTAQPPPVSEGALE